MPGVGSFDQGGDNYNRRAGGRKGPFSLANDPTSLSEVLIGGLNSAVTGTGVGDTEVRPYSAASNIKTVKNEGRFGFGSKAVMSMDGIFRPVSQSGDGDLPGYVTPQTHSGTESGEGYFTSVSVFQGLDYTGAKGLTGPGTMHPPHMTYIPDNATGISGSIPEGYEIYSQVIGLSYLNPIVHPDFNHYGWQSGHDIDIVARGTGLPEEGHLSTVIEKLQGRNPYSIDTRHIALRGPLIMTSWTYDLNGKPVPNAADTEANARSGIFTPTGLTNSFLSGWLEKSDTWPVAPIDLRLDRRRGVFVSPPSYSLIIAQAEENISGLGQGEARMLNGPPLYDVSGNLVQYYTSGDAANGPTFQINDVLNTSISSGDRLLAYYDSVEDRYYRLGGAGGGGGGSPWIRFKLSTLLTQGDLFASGIVLEAWNNSPDAVNDQVRLLNLAKLGAGNYEFAGPINNVGYATYDADNDPGGWRIIYLACEPAPAIADACTYCSVSGTTRNLRAIVAGVQDDVCTECPENLDGTYYLNQSGSNTCIFSANFNGGGCGPDELTVEYSDDAGAGLLLTATMWYSDSGDTGYASNIVWQKTIATGVGGAACTRIDETLPYVSEGGNTDCDGVQSVIRITAI
jgi:hypothetical protein